MNMRFILFAFLHYLHFTLFILHINYTLYRREDQGKMQMFDVFKGNMRIRPSVYTLNLAGLMLGSTLG